MSLLEARCSRCGRVVFGTLGSCRSPWAGSGCFSFWSFFSLRDSSSPVSRLRESTGELTSGVPSTLPPLQALWTNTHAARHFSRADALNQILPALSQVHRDR